MKIDRRTFIGAMGAAAVARRAPAAGRDGVEVNDVHARLSRTRVHQVLTPSRPDDVTAAVEAAARSGRAVSVCGGRHSMGGQPFGAGTTLLDVRRLDRMIRLDPDAGLVEVEAGIQWPALLARLAEAQPGEPRPWAIRQKQTGADRLTLAGALSSNIHSRGLAMAPFVGDVESFAMVDASGRTRRCSRTENPELFRLACGGYGLFGVVTALTLRLARRQKLERVVEIGTTDDLVERVQRRVADGYLYGDFQFAIDPASDDFLRKGVFCCYRPAPPSARVDEARKELSGEDWGRLIRLAHVDKTRAFQEYSAYYLSTNGQYHWSDTHQLSFYLDGYHTAIDADSTGSEMLAEVYVPRPRLELLLSELRRAFRANGASIPYGTIRFIEKDEETFLPWARERYACIVFNLHVPGGTDGEARTADAFRTLIDRALAHGGSYYLTYHRYARRDQVLAAYPQFPAFLAAKRRLDPEERFQSDWYRHYRSVFA
ncbi:MAG: FAD-binding oxidoreductase [Vicinamibacteria bacterium]